MAVSDCEEGPEYDYAKDLTFRVYNLTGEAQAAVYRMDQSKAAELTARREGENVIRLSLEGATDCRIMICNCAAVSVEGVEYTVLTDCTGEIVCRF